MPTRPVHRILRAIPALSVAALLAICCASASVAATTSASTKSKTHVSIAGKWSGTYSGAFSGTFKLHWTKSGSKLSGSITLSSPPGTYTVTGNVHHGKISFGAVGAGAVYTGTWSGKKMSGHYTSPKGGGSWSAHKT
jgi:hypothetical protein